MFETWICDLGSLADTSSLAMAEMHMCLSMLFRRYRFELFETDESDVKLAHDFFLVSPRLDSEGVRVTVRQSAAS